MFDVALSCDGQFGVGLYLIVINVKSVQQLIGFFLFVHLSIRMIAVLFPHLSIQPAIGQIFNCLTIKILFCYDETDHIPFVMMEIDHHCINNHVSLNMMMQKL